MLLFPTACEKGIDVVGAAGDGVGVVEPRLPISDIVEAWPEKDSVNSTSWNGASANL